MNGDANLVPKRGRGRPSNITREVGMAVLFDYDRGKNQLYLIRKYHLRSSTLVKFLRSHGRAIRKTRHLKQFRGNNLALSQDEVRAYKKRKETLDTLAARHGVTKEGIRWWLAEHGVRTNKVGRPRKLKPPGIPPSARGPTMRRKKRHEERRKCEAEQAVSVTFMTFEEYQDATEKGQQPGNDQ